MLIIIWKLRVNNNTDNESFFSSKSVTFTPLSCTAMFGSGTDDLTVFFYLSLENFHERMHLRFTSSLGTAKVISSAQHPIFRGFFVVEPPLHKTTDAPDSLSRNQNHIYMPLILMLYDCIEMTIPRADSRSLVANSVADLGKGNMATSHGLLSTGVPPLMEVSNFLHNFKSSNTKYRRT
jgi:hypothetical protein